MSNLNIYNGYLTGIDRELALEDAEIENMSSRIDTMWKMVNLEYEQNIRDAELKVFRENGTYDDLLYLYQEAENEASEKKQGLLSKLFDFIASIFNTIGGWFTQLFGKNGEKKPTPPPEAEQPEVIVTVVNGYTKAKDFIQKLFNAFTTIVTFGLNKKCGTVKAVFIELGVIGLIKSITDALGIDKIKEEVDRMPDDGGDSKKLAAKFREGFEELKTNGKKYRRDGESMINLALNGFSEWKWLNNIINTCNEKIKEFEQKLEQRKAARAAKKNGSNQPTDQQNNQSEQNQPSNGTGNAGANPPTNQQNDQSNNNQPSSGTDGTGANPPANKQGDQPKDTTESSYNNQDDINFIYNNPSSYLTEAENNPEAAPKEPANDQQSQEIDDDTHDNVLKDAAKKIADFITDIIALPFRLTIGAIMKIFHINTDEQTGEQTDGQDGQTGEQTDGQDDQTDKQTNEQEEQPDEQTDGQDSEVTNDNNQDNQNNQNNTQDSRVSEAEIDDTLNKNSAMSITQLKEIYDAGSKSDATENQKSRANKINNDYINSDTLKNLMVAFNNVKSNNEQSQSRYIILDFKKDNKGHVYDARRLTYDDLCNRKLTPAAITALTAHSQTIEGIKQGTNNLRIDLTSSKCSHADFGFESVNFMDFDTNEVFAESELINEIDDLIDLFNSL